MTRRASDYERALVEAALDVRGKDTGGGRRRAPCPMCERVRARADAKLSVYQHADGGWVCFRCGVTGWLSWATPRARAPAEVARPTIVGEAWKRPPAGFVPVFEGEAEDDPAFDLCRDYVAHRGVPREVARALHLGATPSGFLRDHVVVPVLEDSPTGREWHGWVARTLRPAEPGAPTYREPVGTPKGTFLYQQSALRAGSSVPAIVVEGVFDVMPLYPNGAATLTKMSPALFRVILAECRASGRPVVFLPDGDCWRDGDAYALAARAAGLRAGSVRLPPRTDPNEVPAELMEGAALDALASPHPVRIGTDDLA